jgi:hypothetical protein
MIEKIRLNTSVRLASPDVRLLGNRSADRFGLCLHPADFAGKPVLVHSGVGGPRLGRLVTISGYFEMPPPDTEETVVFENTLVIESLDGFPLARAGDAGAVVTTLDGDALGIVFGGDETAVYAAPLGGMIPNDGSWRPVSPDDVRSWNAAIDVPIFADEEEPLTFMLVLPKAKQVEKLELAARLDGVTAIAETGKQLTGTYL